MDPQTMAMLLMQMQQQGVGRESPLTRAFGQMPMYGGVPMQPSQMFDLSGIPGLGTGTTAGTMASMMLQGILPSMMGPNFTPGQFAPTQNLYDHRQSLRYFMERRQAIEQSSRADQETYFKMIRGVARMSGIEYEPGGQQEQAARRFAGDISAISPIISDLMPDTFEKLHGVRGSAQMMARGLFEGGRYRFDPATGRLGMSGASTAQLSQELFESFYGPGQDVTAMKGLGAGRLGQMYDEMVRRGLGPEAITGRGDLARQLSQELARPTSELMGAYGRTGSRELRGMKDKFGIADFDPKALENVRAELDKLDPQAFDAAARSFDASRTKQALEKMTGAVAAMRDIFGDMGRPNAPMIELMNGLQAMTQNGLTNMTGQQAEQSVRQTYAVAKATGLGFQGIMGFAGQAGQILDQLNLSREFAPQIARASAAFGAAYTQAGQPVNFGSMTPEQAAITDIRLRAQAAASPMAARIGGVLQGADTIAREDAAGNIISGYAPDTEAYAFSQAVKAGQNTYTFNGRRKSVNQSATEISRMLIASGVSRSDANARAYGAAGAVEGTISQYNIGDLVREQQLEITGRRTAGQAFTSGAIAELTTTGVPVNERAGLARAIGSSLFTETRKLLDENPRIFDDKRETERNLELERRVRARLGSKASRLSRVQLANIINRGFLEGQRQVKTRGSATSGYGNFLDVFKIGRNRVAGIQRKILGQSAAVAQLQTALSGIGQEGLVGRISDYIQNVGPGGGSIKDLALTALGGIRTGEVGTATSALFEHIAGLQSSYASAGTRMKDPTAIQAERDRILSEIKDLGPDITAVMDKDLSKLSPKAQEIYRKYKETQEEKAKRRDEFVGPMEPTTVASAASIMENRRGGATTIASATTTIRDSRVEMHDLKDVRMTAQNIRIEQVAAAGGTKEPLAEKVGTDVAINGQKITGTLTLEGLDRVVLNGRVDSTNTDTRSV